MVKKKDKKLNFLFLLVLTLSLIPFIQASTLEDTVFFSTTSNSTIYINQSITFDLINLTDDWLEIYNLTNDTVLFQNINLTYVADLKINNYLTNSLAFYSTGLICGNSTISSNDDTLNCTIPANQNLTLIDNFNLTESRRTNSPIVLSRVSTNKLQITSTLVSTVKGIEISFLQDCSTLTSISYQSDSGLFSKNPSYNCVNNVVTIPATELLEIETASSSNELILYLTSTGGSTGGSTGTTIDSGDITPTNSSEVVIIGETENVSKIDLTNLEILNEKLCTGDNELKFKPTNQNNELTIVDSILIKINNKTYKSQINLDTINEYYSTKLNLEKGEYNVTIQVTQDTHTETETTQYLVKNCFSWEKYGTDKGIAFTQLFKDYPMLFYGIGGFLFVIGLFTYLIYKFK